MSKHDVVRSWKDPYFRAALGAEERARLPENPSGIVEVPAELLGVVAGGVDPDCRSLWMCPTVSGCTTY